jgi:hypothetical protein
MATKLEISHTAADCSPSLPAAVRIAAPECLSIVQDTEHVRRHLNDASRSLVHNNTPEYRALLRDGRLALKYSKTKEQFVLIADMLREKLLADGEFAVYEKWKPYLHGPYTEWYYAAIGLPSMLPETNPLERKNRGQHEETTRNCLPIVVLMTEIPKLLKSAAYNPPEMKKELQGHPICMLREAFKFTQVKESINEYSTSGDCSFFYMNLRADEDTVVSQLRCKKYRSLLRGDAEARAFFKNFAQVQKYSALVEVVLYEKFAPNVFHKEHGQSCSCYFFDAYNTCPHLLAVLCIKGCIDLASLTADPFVPNKRRGRKRGKHVSKIDD